MSTYSDAAAGLRKVLQDNITGLVAYDHPADSVSSFPAAVILPEAIDLLVAIRGNSYEASFRVVFLISSADDDAGFKSLYDYIDPAEASKSVKKAVDTDNTLDGKVDSSQVRRIENIGRRELGGGFYFGFDAIVDFIKTVA